MSGPTGFFPDQAALDAASVDNSTPAPSDSGSTDQSTTQSTTLAPTAQVLSSQPSLYVTAADILAFTVYNSNANLTAISVTYRILAPDGTVITGVLAIPNLTADRAGNSVFAVLTEGFLISVQVNNIGGVPLSRGQCYAGCSLQRGAVGNLNVVYGILGDYVSSSFFPGWPTNQPRGATEGPGFVTMYSAPAVLPSTEIKIVQPANTRWRIVAITANFATTATVQNRTPRFVVVGALGQVYEAGSPQAQTASQFVVYALGAGVPQYSIPAVLVQLPLANDLIVNGGDTIETVTTNMAIGDQWNSMYVQVEEWIDV